MIDRRAAVVAGLVASVASTLAQIALWFALTDALPAVLWRDTRLAAAIVLGRDVLGSSPPDASIAIVATVVHVALSLVYGLALAAVIDRLGAAASLVAGIAFGAIVYAVNMYGFTAVFPWFVAARDAITAVAHLAFGASAAIAYRIAAARPRRASR